MGLAFTLEPLEPLSVPFGTAFRTIWNRSVPFGSSVNRQNQMEPFQKRTDMKLCLNFFSFDETIAAVEVSFVIAAVAAVEFFLGNSCYFTGIGLYETF